MDILWIIIILAVAFSLFGYTPYNRGYYPIGISHGLLGIIVLLIVLKLLHII